MRLVDDATPAQKQLHLIVDNYATHKHPAVQRWLKRHPRFHIHFTPTSASWLVVVERFRDLTANRLLTRSFRDVIELVTAIEDYVDRNHNDIQETLHLDRIRLRYPRKSEAYPKGWLMCILSDADH